MGVKSTVHSEKSLDSGRTEHIPESQITRPRGREQEMGVWACDYQGNKMKRVQLGKSVTHLIHSRSIYVHSGVDNMQ